MSLDALPYVVQRVLFEQLDVASTIGLSLVSKSLHEDVKAYSKIFTHRPNIHALLQMELWPKYNGQQERLRAGEKNHLLQPCSSLDSFACSSCLRIRDTLHFTDKMVKKSSGKLSSSLMDTRQVRRCIDCLVAVSAVKPGRLVKFGGRWHSGGGYGSLCTYCQKFTLSDVALDGDIHCTVCGRQFDIKPPRSQLGRL